MVWQVSRQEKEAWLHDYNCEACGIKAFREEPHSEAC